MGRLAISGRADSQRDGRQEMSGHGYIAEESDRRCELCGKIAETRPYGPKGERVCFACGMKDERSLKDSSVSTSWASMKHRVGHGFAKRWRQSDIRHRLVCFIVGFDGNGIAVRGWVTEEAMSDMPEEENGHLLGKELFGSPLPVAETPCDHGNATSVSEDKCEMTPECRERLLVRLLKETLPQLRWGSCHGNNCPELIKEIENATRHL